MRRLLALSLAFALSPAPSLAAAGRTPARTPSAPKSPQLRLPAVPQLPITTVPGLKVTPIATPKAEVPQARLAVERLAAAKQPEKAAPKAFDGLGPVKKDGAAEPVFAENPGTEGSREGPRLESRSAAAHSPSCSGACGAPPSPKAGAKAARPRWFKRAVVTGLLAASLAPVLYSAVPSAQLLYALPAAFALAGTAWLASKTIKKIRSWAAPRAPPTPGLAAKTTAALTRPRSAARILAAMALGLAFGALPHTFSSEATVAGWNIVTPKRELRAVPADFGEDVARVLEKNPEGRRLLGQLRDHGGTLRMPRFYVGKLDAAFGFYFPFTDGVVLDPTSFTEPGVGVEEFMTDRAARMKYLNKRDELIYHELYHALQFRRRWVPPGLLERFPTQVLKLLPLEMEFEAHAFDRLYAHEKLKQDPLGAAIQDDTGYERFLETLDGFFGDFAGLDTYQGFSNIESKEYEAVLGGLRRDWPRLSVEGYMLLSRRHPEKAAEYIAKARARAAEYGLPDPAPPVSSEPLAIGGR